jgi:hypothetical protein
LKQLIVLAATVILGIYIFSLIASEKDGSIYSIVRDVWLVEVSIRDSET